MSENQTNEAQSSARGETPKVTWDDSTMRSSYANVCTVSATREEVFLLFGTSQAWQSGQQEVTVRLTDRMILSPFAAKRLATLLNAVITDYENKHGPLA